MITEVNEYQELAARTMDRTRSLSKELITFGLGIAGEAGEVLELEEADGPFDYLKLVKELGDVLWYMSGFSTLLARPLSELFFLTEGQPETKTWVEVFRHTPTSGYGNPLMGMVSKACKVADYIKKVEGHGHNLSPFVLHGLLRDVTVAWAKTLRHYGVDPAEVAQANIDKLAKRYPQGFTEERSKNRVD